MKGSGSILAAASAKPPLGKVPVMAPPLGPQKHVAVQSVNLLPDHRKGHQPKPVDTTTPLPSAQQLQIFEISRAQMRS